MNLDDSSPQTMKMPDWIWSSRPDITFSQFYIKTDTTISINDEKSFLVEEIHLQSQILPPCCLKSMILSQSLAFYALKSLLLNRLITQPHDVAIASTIRCSKQRMF